MPERDVVREPACLTRLRSTSKTHGDRLSADWPAAVTWDDVREILAYTAALVSLPITEAMVERAARAVTDEHGIDRLCQHAREAIHHRNDICAVHDVEAFIVPGVFVPLSLTEAMVGRARAEFHVQFGGDCRVDDLALRSIITAALTPEAK